MIYSDCFIFSLVGGNQAIHLKEATMPILNRDVCNAADIYRGLVKDSMICAGHMEGGIDACQVCLLNQMKHPVFAFQSLCLCSEPFIRQHKKIRVSLR